MGRAGSSHSSSKRFSPRLRVTRQLKRSQQKRLPPATSVWVSIKPREPNAYLGRLVPLECLSRLNRAELQRLIVPGEDEESTEAFRARYGLSPRSLARKTK